MNAAAVAGAVLLASVLAAPPAAAYRTEQADSVLAVLATGEVAETPFVSERGVAYTVVVTGTFARDGHGGLADCGYADVNASVAGQDWQPSATTGITVDGVRADCGAYDDTHTYVITVEGTGARLRFAVADPSYADNAGALTVAVLTDLDVDAGCVHTVMPLPNSSSGYVVVAVEAHVTGANVLGSGTWVACSVAVGGTSLGVVSAQSPARAATAVERFGPVPLGSVEKCLYAAVTAVVGGHAIHERSWPCTS